MEPLYGKPVWSTTDWPFQTLNKKTVRDYLHFFHNCGMRVILERRNTSFRLIGKIGAAIGRLPVLERYLTRYMYYILERPDDQPRVVPEAAGMHSSHLARAGTAARPVGPAS
jgi:hypothetical protein